MVHIAAKWRPSRRANGMGTVLLLMHERPAGLSHAIALGINCTQPDVLAVHRSEIARRMMQLHELLARHDFTALEIVAAEFKSMLANPAMLPVVDPQHFQFDATKVSFARQFIAPPPSEPPTATSKSTLGGFIEHLIQEFKARGQESTARNLRSTLLCLNGFTQCHEVSMQSVSPEFIAAFEAHLSERNLSASTRAFYLRTLRLALNHAAAQGLTSAACAEWFAPGSTTAFTQRPAERNDVALSTQQLKSLATLHLKHDPKMQLARDLFMFSFYMQGMELADIAALTPQSLTAANSLLSFRRRSNGLVRQLKISPQALQIIARHHCPDSPTLFSLPGNVFANSRSAIDRQLKLLGAQIGAPSLSFKMARATWLELMAQESFSLPASLLFRAANGAN